MHRSVTCMRLGVFLPFRRVVTMFLPLAFPRPCSRWFMVAPCFQRWKEVFQWWHVVFTLHHWRLSAPPLGRICVVFVSVLFCYLGYYFMLWETIIVEFVLVHIFLVVIISDSSNTFTASVIV